MKVDSRYIKSLSYDSETHTLIVHFRDGFSAKYFQVHQTTYQAILNADSHSEKFHELMAGKRYVVVKEAA